MRYVIVDPEGASRMRFGSLREVREWARCQNEANPDLLDELLLLTFDAAGNEVANQWLADYVPDSQAATYALVGSLERATSTQPVAVGPGLLDLSALSEASSGTAASKRPSSRHQGMPAIETPDHAAAETVGV
jgi:hypothetical protein